MDNALEFNADMSDLEFRHITNLFDGEADAFDPKNSEYSIEDLDQLLHSHCGDPQQPSQQPQLPQQQLQQQHSLFQTSSAHSTATLETPEITQDGVSCGNHFNGQCTSEAGQMLNDLVNRCVFGPDQTPNYPFPDDLQQLDLNLIPGADFNEDSADGFLQPPMTLPLNIKPAQDLLSKQTAHFPDKLFKQQTSDTLTFVHDSVVLNATECISQPNQPPLTLSASSSSASYSSSSASSSPPCAAPALSTSSCQSHEELFDFNKVPIDAINTSSPPKDTPVAKDTSKLFISSGNFDRFQIILPVHSLAPNVKLTKPGQRKEKPNKLPIVNSSGDTLKSPIAKSNSKIPESPPRKNLDDALMKSTPESTTENANSSAPKYSAEDLKSTHKAHKKRKIAADIIKSPDHMKEKFITKSSAFPMQDLNSVPKTKTLNSPSKKKFRSPIKILYSRMKEGTHSKGSVGNRKKTLEIKPSKKSENNVESAMPVTFPSISKIKIPKKDKSLQICDQQIVSYSPLLSLSKVHQKKEKSEKEEESEKSEKVDKNEAEEDKKSKGEAAVAKVATQSYLECDFLEMSPSKFGKKRKLDKEYNKKENVAKKVPKKTEGDSTREDCQAKKQRGNESTFKTETPKPDVKLKSCMKKPKPVEEQATNRSTSKNQGEAKPKTDDKNRESGKLDEAKPTTDDKNRPRDNQVLKKAGENLGKTSETKSIHRPVSSSSRSTAHSSSNLLGSSSQFEGESQKLDENEKLCLKNQTESFSTHSKSGKRTGKF